MIGPHIAKIKDYGMGVTKSSNKPQAIVQFHFIHDGQNHEYTWYGTLAPDNNGDRKGIAITLKALVAMGLTQEGADRMQRDFFRGPESGILDMTKELKIELQEEKVTDDKGVEKTVTRVQWVNDPNDVYMIKKLTEAENFQAMQGLDIRGDIFKILQEKGAKGAGANSQVHSPNNNGGGQQNFNNNQNQNQNFNQGGGQNQGQGQQQNYSNQNQNNSGNNNNGQNYNQNGQQNFNNNPGNGQQNGNGGGFKAPF